MTDRNGWMPIESAPRDGTWLWGYDPKHGRFSMRLWTVGDRKHQETWAIDPTGLLDPPEPLLWSDAAALPSPPAQEDR